MRLTEEPGCIERTQRIFKDKDIAVIGFHIEHKQSGDSDNQLEISTRLPGDYKVEQLLKSGIRTCIMEIVCLEHHANSPAESGAT